MNRIQDVITLVKESFQETIYLFKKIPLLIAIPAIHFLVYFFVINLGVLRFGIFSNLILGLFYSVILASYFYVLHQAIYYKKFKFEYLYQGVKVFFLKTWFFVIVVNLLIYVMALLGGAAILGPYLTMIPFVLFNPMPEIIYISEYNERDMFFYNLNFIKRNYLPWYASNLILLSGLFIVLLISGTIPFVANIVLLVYFGFAMVFRGYLFKKLHNTNYRKRQFQSYNH